MDMIGEVSKLLTPALIFILLVSLLALRVQIDKNHRQDEEIRKAFLYSMKQTAYIIKYCGAPVEVLLEDLKDLNPYLASIPSDDILGQLMDKYLRS